MASVFTRMEDVHQRFIARQRVFFVASAADHGRVNLSPKGLDALRIVDRTSVVYIDLTGSGNETAAHARADGRLTIMFCAFEGAPLILRLYGRARIVTRGQSEYTALLARHFSGEERLGARQFVLLDVDMVQTSCGYGVPLFDYRDERDTLTRWAENKGDAGLRKYRRDKNTRSIDGFPTGIA